MRFPPEPKCQLGSNCGPARWSADRASHWAQVSLTLILLSSLVGVLNAQEGAQLARTRLQPRNVSLAAPYAIVSSSAGSGTVNVTADQTWTAVSSDPWLTVNPPSGTGNGVLTYSYTANTGSVARVAAISVAGKTFTVDQVSSTGVYTSWGRSAYGDIRTVAGTGTTGLSGDGGLATAAQLNTATDVAVDARGNIYIAEQNNHRIRKIDSATGVITTIAGTTAGFAGDGGPGTAAQLYQPVGVALDNAGNIYIADFGAGRVRKLDSQGMISTVAGKNVVNLGDGGLATLAKIPGPTGLAVDSAGNIYISDSLDHRIRKVTASTGIITTIAGTGVSGFSGDGLPAVQAQVSNPQRIALDASGNLYIADRLNQRIRRVDAVSGLMSTIAGTSLAGFNGDGPVVSTNLLYPAAVALDPAGNVYFADSGSNRARKLTVSSGQITTLAGTGNQISAGDGGPATSAQLNSPLGIAIDATGNLYTAEATRVRFIDYTTPQVGVNISSISLGALGGSGSLTLTLTSAGTPWFATSDSAWLTLGAATGTGSGTLNFTVAQNTGTASRTGNININGVVVTVTQAGRAVLSVGAISPEPSAVGQSYAIALSLVAAGGNPTGTITVSDGTASNICPPTALSCSLASPAPGIKTITVTYSGDSGFASTALSRQHEVYTNDVAATLTTSAITYETRPAIPADWTAASAANTGAAYKAAWNAAVSLNAAPPSGYASVSPSTWLNLANTGGVHTNVASHVHVDFTLTQRSYLELQITPDFGWGGALYLDGGAVLVNANDLSGSGNLNLTTFLGAGPHALDVYGADYCCDIGSSGAYRLNGAPAVSFTTGAVQTISFPTPPGVFLGSGTVALLATSTSGLPVTFTSNTLSVCTVNVTIVTLLSAGSCSVTASQAGNVNFVAATPVTRTFTVSAPANYVTLTLKDGIGVPTQTVEVALNLTSNGTATPAAFQTDLHFDTTKLTFSSARIGAQGTSAAKSVSSSVQPNGDARILVAGLNQSVIPNGTVAYASFTLKPAFTSGSTLVTPTGCLASDTTGNALATPCVGGTIRYATCDINTDGNTTVSDVQLIINEALGVVTAIHDLNSDGAVNVADVQKVINAALGLGCVLP